MIHQICAVALVTILLLQIVSFSGITNLQEADASSRSTKEFLTYKNEINGYQINYPSNWEVGEQSSDRVVFSYPSESQDDFGILLTILHNFKGDAVNELSLDESATAMIEVMKTVIPGLQVNKDIGSVLDKNPAREINYSATLGDVFNVKGIFMFTIKDESWYTLWLMIEPKNYFDEVGTIQKMFDSFEFIDSQQSDVNEAMEFVPYEIPSEFLTYEDPTHQYKIDYPSDWVVQDYGTKKGFALPLHLATDPSAASAVFSVTVSPLENEGISVDQYAEQNIRLLKNLFLGFQLDKDIESVLDGIPARTFESSFELYGTNVKRITTLSIHDEKSYNLNFIVESGAFTKYKPMAEKMLESFVI